MTKRIPMFVFAAVLTLAAVGQPFAQGQSKDETAINDKNAATGQELTMLVPQQCFSSGSGVTFLKICITDNGNISWFESPAGKVHLQQREGYAVCSSVTHPYDIVHGYDANVAAAGWGNSTVSQPNGAGTFPLIITRQSLDSVIQLKQTFTRNTAERGIDVKMDVKNLTAMDLNSVYLSRYFDGDIDNSSKNLYDYTYGSVWARGTGSALTLTSASSGIQVSSNVYPYATWDPFGNPQFQYARGCEPEKAYTLGVLSDFVGGLTVYLQTVNPGQTKTVTLFYRRD